MGSINGSLQTKSSAPDEGKIILTCFWNKLTDEIKVQISLNLDAGKEVTDLYKQILKLPTDSDFDNYCQNYNFTPTIRSEAKITIYQYKEINDPNVPQHVVTFPNNRAGIGDYTLAKSEHLIVVELLAPDNNGVPGGVVSTVQGIAD